MQDTELSGAGASAPDALVQLGFQYALGRGVRACPVTAHQWFNLAALRGNTEAKRFRAEIASELSAAQIAQALRQARDWLKAH